MEDANANCPPLICKKIPLRIHQNTPFQAQNSFLVRAQPYSRPSPGGLHSLPQPSQFGSASAFPRIQARFTPYVRTVKTCASYFQSFSFETDDERESTEQLVNPCLGLPGKLTLRWYVYVEMVSVCGSLLTTASSNC